jgi:tRNA(fMet)-specific endonuclease VapC
MGILIDTGVFICWEREGGAVDLGAWDHHGEPAISVITQSELLVGVHRADTTERRETRLRFVNSILSHLLILPIDSPIAEVHARIVSLLRLAGLTIGPHDNWIAATAMVHGYGLLTTNASEFSRVPGLTVLPYPESA